MNTSELLVEIRNEKNSRTVNVNENMISSVRILYLMVEERCFATRAATRLSMH